MHLPATLLAAAVLTAAVPPTKTKNVILVTADGLRWQEVFTGIDPLLMREKAAGMEKAEDLRRKLWRDSPAERRALLMPFLWKQLAGRGLVLRDVTVTNAYRVSYPGYSEILTGRAQDERIRGNDPMQNPAETVLEFLTKRLTSKAALFGSWEAFHWIGESRPGTIVINAGYRESDVTPRIAELSRLQFLVLPPWREVRHDYITFEMALDYLKVFKPRVLYISLGETDDWAHDKRYDRVLDLTANFDRCLETLWSALQALPEYRDATSLIVTTDHGRGSTLEDWSSHGAKVPGADRIWIAVAGPDTPATGEASAGGEVHQRDVAPTMLGLLGIDYREYKGVTGKPIRQPVRH